MQEKKTAKASPDFRRLPKEVRDDMVTAVARASLNPFELLSGRRSEARNSRKSKALAEGCDCAKGLSAGGNFHFHTYASVADGVSRPEDMVDATAKYGYRGGGVSDHGTMAMVLKAGKAAKSYSGLRFVESGVYLNGKPTDRKEIEKLVKNDKIRLVETPAMGFGEAFLGDLFAHSRIEGAPPAWAKAVEKGSLGQYLDSIRGSKWRLVYDKGDHGSAYILSENDYLVEVLTKGQRLAAKIVDFNEVKASVERNSVGDDLLLTVARAALGGDESFKAFARGEEGEASERGGESILGLGKWLLEQFAKAVSAVDARENGGGSKQDSLAICVHYGELGQDVNQVVDGGLSYTQSGRSVVISLPGEFKIDSDFKILSGIELYVSWKDKANPEYDYHHMTVYATGQKGHSQLVKLTTLGGLPSRRYVSRSGFFRPRVFLEDIELAANLAPGEIIVTTGCPGSILSQALKAHHYGIKRRGLEGLTDAALRQGGMLEARKLLDWGTQRLPKGTFFAELHLCDTRHEYNSLYAHAENKFYAKVAGGLVSRFRLADPVSASQYAQDYENRLVTSILATAYRGGSKKASTFSSSSNTISPEESLFLHGGALAEISRDALADSDSARAESAFDVALMNEDLTFLRKELGINFDRWKDLPRDDLKVGEDAASASLDGAAMILDSSPHLRSDDAVAGVVGSDKAGLKAKKSKLKKTHRASGKLSDKAAFLDEETVATLALVSDIVNANETRDIPSGWGAKNVRLLQPIARLVLFVIVETVKNEDLKLLNSLNIVREIMTSLEKFESHDFRTGFAEGDFRPSEQAAALTSAAYMPKFGLDAVIEPGEHNLRACRLIARGVYDLVMRMRASLDFAYSVGSDDEIEEEWRENTIGNWMEGVNKELIALAKEYDIPLMMATDAHMTYNYVKPLQDAIIKRGKQRSWHMRETYSIPPSSVHGFLAHTYGLEMLESGVLEFDDILEAMGSCSSVLSMSKSAGTFKWSTDVPKIDYSSHPNFELAKEILDSGFLAEFLGISEESRPIEKETTNDEIRFTKASLNIGTALIVAAFLVAIDKGLIPDDQEYYNRIRSELYLSQEVPNEQLADFFLFLEVAIHKFRKDGGLSVGPGRGSSGGMLTAMVTRITNGDPIRHKMLASRWMNRGRKMKGAHADIDVDVNDRHIAGVILANIARSSFAISVTEKPLDELEAMIMNEMFYTSAPVQHVVVNGIVHEVKVGDKKAIESIMAKQSVLKSLGADEIIKIGEGEVAAAVAANVPRPTLPKTASADSAASMVLASASEESMSDDAEALSADGSEGTMVRGAPMCRVGTFGSLKSKAAVQYAIKMFDTTSMNEKPSFAQATPEWLQKNATRVRHLTEDERNKIFEEEIFANLSAEERNARRTDALAKAITASMTAGASLARLYKSEKDFFEGAVYGKTPSYWEAGVMPPQGSRLAQEYFAKNRHIEKIALEAVGVVTNIGVHAGGFCVGRELLSRVPMRFDKFGAVAQYDMKDLETVGVLKFDLLGLDTLNHIQKTFIEILKKPYEDHSWWLPDRKVYEDIKAGKESTDELWRYAPLSTPEAVKVFCTERTGLFQVDTRVFDRGLKSLQSNRVLEIVENGGKQTAEAGKWKDNQTLVSIIDAQLANFRPGPMKPSDDAPNGSHVEYLDRMHGKPWVSIHGWLDQFVKDTFGVITYQEQVMAIWAKGVGIDIDHPDVDEVRRAMGKKDEEALAKMRAMERFEEGLACQGVSADVAQKIWKKIAPFAEYGFNKPHSYHYAVITCIELFQKAHYLEEFFGVKMSSVTPEDAARLVAALGTVTLPCAVRSEHHRWTRQEGRWYPGLSSVRGLSEKAGATLAAARERLLQTGFTKEDLRNGKVSSKEYFLRLGRITPAFARVLAQSGLLRSLGTDPKQISEGYAEALIEIINGRGLSSEQPPPETR